MKELKNFGKKLKESYMELLEDLGLKDTFLYPDYKVDHSDPLDPKPLTIGEQVEETIKERRTRKKAERLAHRYSCL